MPYSSNKALPDAVRRLPSHAQDVWRATFNAAYRKYGKDEPAARAAWAAVKRMDGDD